MTIEPMKKILAPLLACALTLASIPLITQLFAERSAAETVVPASVSEAEFPIGRKCIVTLDPRAQSTPVFAGDSKILTGLSAPDVMEGKMLADRGQWIVIKTVSRENWVPKSKILLISFTD